MEPFTYKNGSKRIDFTFCTQIIDTYITRCGILPFDTISPTPHRGIYLDINILDFLKDKIHLPTPAFRILSTKAPDSVSCYKHNMILCLKEHNILQQITAIDNKIRNNTLVVKDLNNMNFLDDVITKIMITSEEKVKKSKFTHPWSPQLAVSILTVTIWRLKLSAVKNKKNKQYIVQKLVTKIQSFNHQLIPPNTESNDINYILSELKKSSRELKETKRNAKSIRQHHIMSRAQEADIIGNSKLAFYIRQLITIEKQIESNKRIHYLTPTKVNNNMQSIAIPKDKKLH